MLDATAPMSVTAFLFLFAGCPKPCEQPHPTGVGDFSPAAAGPIPATVVRYEATRVALQADTRELAVDLPLSTLNLAAPEPGTAVNVYLWSFDDAVGFQALVTEEADDSVLLQASIVNGGDGQVVEHELSEACVTGDGNRGLTGAFIFQTDEGGVPVLGGAEAPIVVNGERFSAHVFHAFLGGDRLRGSVASTVQRRLAR